MFNQDFAHLLSYFQKDTNPGLNIRHWRPYDEVKALSFTVLHASEQFDLIRQNLGGRQLQHAGGLSLQRFPAYPALRHSPT
jgi:hypothetical protein